MISYPLMVIWTVLMMPLFPLGICLWKLFTGLPLNVITRRFVSLYGRGWIRIMSPFVSLERQNFEGKSFGEKGIIVVNHLSYFDTYFMGALPLTNLVFIVRAWAFKLYWYTFFMKLAGYVNVESLDWKSSEVICRSRLEEGGFLVFFPEGHRSKDGKMHRFHSGAFKLAVETGVPLFPLCLTGTDVLLPPSRLWMKPCKVKMKLLDPIDPTQYQGEGAYVDMRNDVKRLMLQHVEEMSAA